MSWIRVIGAKEAKGALLSAYQRLGGHSGKIDNVLAVHSLRPHTLTGHMALYKAVLHHAGNQLATDFLETVGVHVSLLNRCAYCVAHHKAGLARIVGSDKAELIHAALVAQDFEPLFDARLKSALVYTRKLTLHPQELVEDDLEPLRRAGLDDGEILEINQVASYFNYVNRSVLGLGVNLHGDELGLSPGNTDNLEDWRHG